MAEKQSKYWDDQFQTGSEDAAAKTAGEPSEAEYMADGYYDWMVDAEDVCATGVLDWLRPEHDILLVGSGRSRLPIVLYERGLRRITCTDISSVVTDDMARRHAQSHPEIRWEVSDVTDMSAYADASFDAVIDKHTSDTLQFRSRTRDGPLLLAGMLAHVQRVLRPEGRFVVVTPRRRPRFLYTAEWHVLAPKVVRRGGDAPLRVPGANSSGVATAALRSATSNSSTDSARDDGRAQVQSKADVDDNNSAHGDEDDESAPLRGGNGGLISAHKVNVDYAHVCIKPAPPAGAGSTADMTAKTGPVVEGVALIRHVYTSLQATEERNNTLRKMLLAVRTAALPNADTTAASSNIDAATAVTADAAAAWSGLEAPLNACEFKARYCTRVARNDHENSNTDASTSTDNITQSAHPVELASASASDRKSEIVCVQGRVVTRSRRGRGLFFFGLQSERTAPSTATRAELGGAADIVLMLARGVFDEARYVAMYPALFPNAAPPSIVATTAATTAVAPVTIGVTASVESTTAASALSAAAPDLDAYMGDEIHYLGGTVRQGDIVRALVEVPVPSDPHVARVVAFALVAAPVLTNKVLQRHEKLRAKGKRNLQVAAGAASGQSGSVDGGAADKRSTWATGAGVGAVKGGMTVREAKPMHNGDSSASSK